MESIKISFYRVNKLPRFFDFRSLCFLVTFLLVYLRRRNLQKYLFALVFGKYIAPGMSKRLHPYKKELFSSLKEIISHDPKLKQRGSIRILEIGVGSGTNFQYYPDNTHLITLEPNTFFEEYFKSNKNKFPHIKIEKFLIGEAETIPDIKDGSIDAVISTLVLCSVNNLNRVLAEIKRVLCSGGKFYYMEHIGYKSGTWKRFLQNVVEIFWRPASDGCRLCAPISESISEAGFKEICEKEVYLQKELFVLRRNIIGVAIA
ncbi:thiol S-methyltransferase TMT1A-like [Centruroides vittatus]|uniref:thiol S-methyltransferase TMT1A-like n=1 Tax=Centruroides vittatus TaxID=120091 RepID=UPI003510AC71